MFPLSLQVLSYWWSCSTLMISSNETKADLFPLKMRPCLASCLASWMPRVEWGGIGWDVRRQVGSEPEIMSAFMPSLEEAQAVGVYTEKQALQYMGQKMRAPSKGGGRGAQQPS